MKRPRLVQIGKLFELLVDRRKWSRTRKSVDALTCHLISERGGGGKGEIKSANGTLIPCKSKKNI